MLLHSELSVVICINQFHVFELGRYDFPLSKEYVFEIHDVCFKIFSSISVHAVCLKHMISILRQNKHINGYNTKKVLRKEMKI